MKLTRIGNCNNCGACCYIYSQTLKRFHWCEHYVFTLPKHCSVYGTPLRPKECGTYPRGPMDLERVAKWCTLKFIDEKGVVVDAYQDKRVKLTKI